MKEQEYEKKEWKEGDDRKEGKEEAGTREGKIRDDDEEEKFVCRSGRKEGEEKM